MGYNLLGQLLLEVWAGFRLRLRPLRQLGVLQLGRQPPLGAVVVAAVVAPVPVPASRRFPAKVGLEAEVEEFAVAADPWRIARRRLQQLDWHYLLKRFFFD